MLCRTSLSCRSLYCPLHADTIHQGRQRNAAGICLGLRRRCHWVWWPAPLQSPTAITNHTFQFTGHLVPIALICFPISACIIPLRISSCLWPSSTAIPSLIILQWIWFQWQSHLLFLPPQPIMWLFLQLPHRSWLWAPLTWNTSYLLKACLLPDFPRGPRDPRLLWPHLLPSCLEDDCPDKESGEGWAKWN